VFSLRVTRTFAECISGPDGVISIGPALFSAECFVQCIVVDGAALIPALKREK
jgi:hypothetical protein